MAGRREIKGFYSTGQAASLLNMSRRTIVSYCQNGQIKAEQHPATKQWQISQSALAAFMTGIGLDPQSALEKSPSENRPRSERPAHILIVDDEKTVRFTVQSILEDENIVVHEAADGESGLAQVAQRTYDLILLDLQMPIVNGPEFLRLMAEKNIDIPIVIITGYPEGDLMAEAIQYGPVTLLAKPLRRHALIKLVNGILQRSGEYKQAR